LWHAVIPTLAYSILLVAGIVLRSRPTAALFWIGGSALLLLYVGIHNAWDTVIYIATERWPKPNVQPESQGSRPPVDLPSSVPPSSARPGRKMRSSVWQFLA
jgi:hypothetical protein